MKTVQTSFIRAIIAVVVGLLLIKYREDTVTWITIIIGVLFFISGLISCIVYLVNRNAKPVAAIAAMPRAKTLENPRGIMKFVIDAETDQILGAQLLVVESMEVINLVALAMRHNITASQLRDEIYTHPSITEGLNEVLAAAQPVA